MKNIDERLLDLGIKLPEVMLPKAGVDMEAYSVIACDQHSAERAYWDRVTAYVGQKPSTLNMILPEAYLGDRDGSLIPAAMDDYVNSGVIESIGETFVLVLRQTSEGTRTGLMVALDLEQYDYRTGWQGLIRATEMTVPDRLPPRVRIRKQAALELPHVMVLIDDPEDVLMGGLRGLLATSTPLYDFMLMEDGGRIQGFRADDEAVKCHIAAALEGIRSRRPGMLYAMGDGNHSFAAAKACWEALKETLPKDRQANHPARYSMVELVNIHDKGLSFEPIHRLLMNVDKKAVQADLGFDANNPPSLQELQPKLDAWLSCHPEASLEYIHGEDECQRLGQEQKNLAIVFGTFHRGAIFSDVMKNGVLVRKSFSMGQAKDKRYYLEARRIKD